MAYPWYLHLYFHKAHMYEGTFSHADTKCNFRNITDYFEPRREENGFSNFPLNDITKTRLVKYIENFTIQKKKIFR